MKKMFIYEPAMCCSTGLCGVGVDPELLRVSTVISNLEKNGIRVERYNPSSAPQEFVNSQIINERMMQQGVDILPITMVDGKIVKEGGYLTNAEFAQILNVPEAYLGKSQKTIKTAKVVKKSGGCGCDGGCC